MLAAKSEIASTKYEQDWVDLEKRILELIRNKNEALLNKEYDLSQQMEQDQKNLEEKKNEETPPTRLKLLMNSELVGT